MQHIARAHIEHPCPRCSGEGLRCYNNGSGWRGGVSFSKPTIDLCDECWGSGDAETPFRNLREFEAECERARSVSLLDEVLRWYRGANRAAVSELAALLHKIDEGRVGRGASFAACRLAGVLASRLEDAAKGEGT